MNVTRINRTSEDAVDILLGPTVSKFTTAVNCAIGAKYRDKNLLPHKY